MNLLYNSLFHKNEANLWRQAAFRQILLGFVCIVSVFPLHGQINRALHLGSTADYVEIPHSSALNFNNNFTVAFWVRVDKKQQDASSSLHHILTKANASTSSVPFDFTYISSGGNAGYLQLERKNTNGATISQVLPVFIDDGRFHHIALVKDSINTSTLMLNAYIDGNLIGTLPDVSGITNNNSSIFIGRKGDVAGSFSGIVDEVKIWKTKRTQVEIQSDMTDATPSTSLAFYNMETGVKNQVNPTVLNGYLNGTPQFLFTGANMGNALHFDGNNDWVSVVNNIGLITNQLTLEAWIRPEMLTGNRTIAAQQGKWLLQLKGGKIYYKVTTTTGSVLEIYSNNTLLNANKWYHITAVYNTSGTGTKGMSIYVNGELENSLASTSTLLVATTGAGLSIGANSSPTATTDFFVGMLDEVQIWNSLRSTTQIASDMNKGDITPNANHLAYFTCNQGIANAANGGQTALLNTFANGNGTLTNFALTGSTSNFVARAATLAAPNLDNLGGTLYNFKGQVTQAGTGDWIETGFVIDNVPISTYPTYTNTNAYIEAISTNAANFNKEVEIFVGPYNYKSYHISTEGMILSDESTGPCVTTFPIGNIALTTGANKSNAKWRKVAGATAYDWLITPPNGNVASPLRYGSTTSSSDTTVMLDNLDPGSKYYFYVRAKCGGGLSAWVGPAYIATLATPVLSADSLLNDGYIDIKWDLPVATFAAASPLGVHLQLKSGTTLLYEQDISDYLSYQGAQQPTFTFNDYGLSNTYYKIDNTTYWPSFSSWTMESWVKTTATSTNSANFFRIVGTSDSIVVGLDSVKNMKIHISGTDYYFSHGQLPVEAWYHLAVSYGGGSATLYIDGVAISTISVPTVAVSSPSYQFLHAANLTYMAEFRLWDRIRTAKEVEYSRFVASFSGVAQNNLLCHLKWTTQTTLPIDLATQYDGWQNGGSIYFIGGNIAAGPFFNPTYQATPYYTAIHGSYRHVTGPGATKVYKLSGLQIGSGATLATTLFPAQDTGKTKPYQNLDYVRADSTPFDINISWKNKSKLSEYFRIRRTDASGLNSVTLATVSGTDKIDSVLTYSNPFSLDDTATFRNGTVYRYYIDTYSSTFNKIFDSLRYDVSNMPQMILTASDNLYTNKVALSWNNLATYGYAIRIERDDEVLATLPATETTYQDLYPIYGQRHRYAVMLLDPLTSLPVAAGFDMGSVQPRGAISGVVRTADGNYAIKNVRIRLTNLSNNALDSTMTDSNGAFAFSNIYYGENGNIQLSAYYPAAPAHVFDDSPRILTLSDSQYVLTNVIFRDKTGFITSSANTGFTLTNFQATPLATDDKVTLSWDYTLTAGDTLRMNLYRGTTLLQVLNATSGTSMSYPDTTGIPNYTYNYSITVYKFQGDTVKVLNAGKEKIIFPAVTPPTVFNTSVNTALGTVSMTWVHTSQNYQGFNVYRAKQTTTPSTPSDTVLIAALPYGTTSFVDKQTLPGTSGYKYVIRARRYIDNLTYESAKVISGSINYPALPSLSALTATPNTIRNSVNLTWTLPSGSPLLDTAGYNFDGYRIYRRKTTPSNSPLSLVGQVYKHFPRAFEDKSGLPATAYTYEVRAFLKLKSPATKKDTVITSNAISKATSYPVIKAPLSLTRINNVNYVALSWIPAANQSGGARNFDGQTVYWKVGTAPADSADIPIAQSNYTVYTNITSANPTTFSVRSYRLINGVKYLSAAVSGTGYATGSNPITLPLPGQFRASQDLPAHVRLSWTYPSYILGNFRIYRDGTLIANLGPESREFYDYTAASYQSYLYEMEVAYQTTTTLKAGIVGKRNTLSSLTGRVMTANTKYGLPYIEVTATAQGYFSRAFTDSTGFYRIDNLPTQQSLPVTVMADGGNTIFTGVNFPASQVFAIEGEIYKTYNMDFVSNYSPAPKDTAQVSNIAFISARPDPARKQVSIAWSPSNQNFDGFEVYRANSLVAEVLKNQAFLVNDKEGTPGVNYLYQVLAYKNGTNGKVYNATLTASATFPVVESPVYLSATPKPKENAVSLTWSHKWSNHTQYEISRNGDLIGTVTTSAPANYKDETGIPGQLYTYSVVAVDIINDVSNYSDPVTVQATFPVLADITNLTTTIPTESGCGIVTHNHVFVEWKYDNACTGFWLYRNAELIASLAPYETSYRDSTGTPGLTSVYEVKAFLTRNGTNYSASGLTTTVLYPVIAEVGLINVVAQNDSGNVKLTWSYTEDAVSGFEIYRETVKIATMKIAENLANRNFSFTDNTGVLGTYYSYNIRAFSKRSGVTYYSDYTPFPCTAAPVMYPSINAPIVPAGLQGYQVASDAAAGYATYVNLRWDYVGNNLDSLKIYRNGALIRTVGPGIRSINYVPNAVGDSWYEIKAYKFAGGNAIYSASLADSGRIAQANFTGAVVTFTATQGTLTDLVKLDWVAVAGATSYTIYRDNVLLQAGVTGITYTDNSGSLVAGKRYIYEIAPNNNTNRRSAEGWSKLKGYIEGNAKTLEGNIGIGGVSIVAQTTIEGSTYYYTATTDNLGSYNIPNVYYGGGTATFYLKAALSNCSVAHVFDPNPTTTMLSAQVPGMLQVNFFDKTEYHVAGKIKRQYTSCGLDSIKVTGKYTFLDGTSTLTTPVYTDPAGYYNLGVNPIQNDLASLTILVDSTKIINSSTSADTLYYRFQSQGVNTWVGNDLYCMDQINELNYQDVRTYPVKINVVNGCGTALTGGKYKVQVQSDDVCYDRTFIVNSNTGQLIADLPAMKLNIHVSGVENLTASTQIVVDYLKYRPVTLILDSVVAVLQGNTSIPEWDIQTHRDLVFHNPPRIVLTKGFDKYLCSDPTKPAIVQQGATYSLNLQVIENFGSDCPVKTGYIKVRNAAAEVVNTQVNFDLATGILPAYSFKAGNPNLVKPYAYNCYFAYYNMSNELLAEKNLTIIVEGSTQLPGSDVIVDPANGQGIVPLPLYVLRDPPGDGSFSTISKGSTLTKNITLSRSLSGGAGLIAEGQFAVFTVGVFWEAKFLAGGGNEKEYTWEVSTTTTADISTSSDEANVGPEADVIVGAGLAMQYGLAKKIKVVGCNITDSTILALGPNGVNTTWIYTVAHIRSLIQEDTLRIIRGDRIQQKGKLLSVAASRLYFKTKIKNWRKILDYHTKETLPYYNLCVSKPPASATQAQKDIYKQWQGGFCKLVRKNATGPFVPKPNIVWNQAMIDAYNVAETVLKNVVKSTWQTMPYDWEFSDAKLQKRQNYIDAQYEGLHGIAAENMTFSAGTEYTKTIESAKSSSTTLGTSTFFNLEGAIGVDLSGSLSLVIAPFGVGTLAETAGYDIKVGAQFALDLEISETAESATENTNTISYTLNDNDNGDQFSVTAIQGISPNQTPYFSLLGGRSSCPYEAGTIAVDAPKVNILKAGGATKYDEALNVDPNGTAQFTLQVASLNPFFTDRDITLKQVLEKNPYGARLQLFGADFIENTFTVAPEPGNSLNLQLNVARGPVEYDYENLQIAALSACDPPGSGDTITFSVHFASPCSNLALAEPENGWVIHRRNLANNLNQEAIAMNAVGFDVDNAAFKRIYFQYRRLGVNNDWKDIPRSYITKDSLAKYQALHLFPNEVPYYKLIWDITDSLTRYPNGDYQLRVVSECLENGVTSYSYSNYATGKIDRNMQLYSTPEPADKKWTYGDEISISFTTDIQCDRVDSTNFVMRNLNDNINGVYQIVPGKTYCHNNKLSFLPTAPMTTYNADTLQFTVRNIYAVTGTLLNDEQWSFGVYARDLYMDNTHFDLQVYQGDKLNLVSHFTNNKLTDSLVYSVLGLTAQGTNNGTYQSWFTARNARNMSILAQKTQNVYFDIDAAKMNVGYYKLDLDVQDSPFSSYPKALSFRIQVVPKPVNWTVNPGNYEHNMTITANYQFTNPLLVNTDTSDRISVWIGNELRGVGKVQKIGTAYATIMSVYGNNADAGKALTFRVWDTSTGTEYDAVPTIARTYSRDAVIGTLSNMLWLNVNQVNDKATYIPFRKGWNLFSLNSTKGIDSVKKVLATLRYTQNGDLLKTATKAATFNGTTWTTANSLHLMDLYHGYQLKLANADTLRITGTLPTTALNKDSLFNGWNLIGAPIAVPTSIQTLLDISKFLSTAKPDSMTLKTVPPPTDPYQNTVAFYKTATKWQYDNASGMESIRPGYGYWIKVNKNTNLCLSTAACATATTTLRLANASHPDFDGYDVQTWVVNPSDYEYNMLIWGYVDIDGKTAPFGSAQGTSDIKVAAYNGNQCRGVGELVYVPEMNRYLMSMFVYANTENEVLDFRIHLPESQKYYQHFEGIRFESDGIVASADNPYRFSNVEPTKAFHAEAYPNPFDRILKIDIEAEKEQDYTFTLSDLMGRVIYQTSETANGLHPHYELKTDKLDLIRGVYLLQVKGSLGTSHSFKLVYDPD